MVAIDLLTSDTLFTALMEPLLIGLQPQHSLSNVLTGNSGRCYRTQFQYRALGAVYEPIESNGGEVDTTADGDKRLRWTFTP